ncbi:MAG: homoserine kinase [Alicyclobacillus macrosporangiidus]|uniref:homoserine kinase n=1 Tax=Alicyclobacillus macrosporangiidus TaxID=392015 RepID=UPI0026EFB855|nr:homoserine kinase [Alicyclobacillus macrosporangiidus]MCL6599998.1 homoserine kinase [Alicyclobacillus macrosporangiidus]
MNAQSPVGMSTRDLPGTSASFSGAPAEAPRFRVRVPATSANLGPGFDCMGIALGLCNEMELEVRGPFSVHVEGEGAALLPRDRTNAVVQAIDRVLDLTPAADVPRDWRLRLTNGIPVAAGLGSSASAIVGGLLLANALLARYAPEHQWSRQQLLDLAVEMEGHPDNVTPALLGGAWLSVVDGRQARSFALPIPEALVFTAAVPNFPLRTEDARRVLPTAIPREDAVWNTAQAARLTLALSTGQLDLLKGGFGDRLHEPYRRRLIPGCEEVRQAAIRAGAITTTLSGAGPTLLAWCDSEGTASQVADEMTLVWREFNIECYTYVLQPRRSETRVEVLAGQVPEARSAGPSAAEKGVSR